MSAKQYFRLTYKAGDPPKNRTVWVYLVKQGPRVESYRVVQLDGDIENSRGEGEMLMCAPEDIVKKVPAKMNNFYAMLEISESMKSFRQFQEDGEGGAPANAAGTGAIASLGVTPPGKAANWGEPGVDNRKKKVDEEDDDSLNEDTFAGASIFDVDMDKVMSVKDHLGKHPRHRYSRYVGTDEVGESIRQHGRKTRGEIVLRDQKTAVMTYLRRKPPVE